MNSLHSGVLNDNLGTRVIVAYKQIPDQPLKALIIKIDSMGKNVDRDELNALLQSNDANNEKDFINTIHRKGLLQHYHNSNYFESVSIDQVSMTPNNSTKIPLRHIINEINKQKGVAPLPTDVDLQNISSANPNAVEQKAEVMETENKKGLAKTVYMQAMMLQADADRKFKEAYDLDPSLRPTNAVPEWSTDVSLPKIPKKVQKVSNNSKTKVKPVAKAKRAKAS